MPYYPPAASGSLDGLTDVIITTPTLNQVIKYNGTEWVNGTDDTGGGGGSFTTGVATLDFTTGSNEATLVVSTPVSSTSEITLKVSGADTTLDHTENDHVYFNLFAKCVVTNIVDGVSFTIKATSLEKLSGTFKVRWSY